MKPRSFAAHSYRSTHGSRFTDRTETRTRRTRQSLEDQEKKVHSMCECQRRQAYRKSHRESQRHGERNPYRGKTRGQVRVKNKVEMQGTTRKVQGRELRGQETFGVEHRSHRGDGARARDESGRTGPERWRDTPRILESSSSRTRIST